MSVEDLKAALGDNAELVQFKETPDQIIVKRIGFISNAKWHGINAVLIENGAKYFPAPESEWRLNRAQKPTMQQLLKEALELHKKNVKDFEAWETKVREAGY